MNRRAVAWTGGSLLLCVAVVWAWSLVSDAGLVSRAFLPSPQRTWAALRLGLSTGPMWDDVLATVRRMLFGWVLASCVGVAVGAMVGMSPLARALLGPTLEFLRPLPASALIPVGIALFGLTQTMVLGVICFGTLWPMLLATVQGFGSVEPRLREVGRLLALPRWKIVIKIALPNALPDIMSGMRLGLAVALILSVVGEMLAGQQGLGLRILLAARAFHAAELFAGVILLGVVGVVTNAALDLIERRILRWMPVRP